MGSIHRPAPVLLLVAITTRHLSAVDWAREQFRKRYGSIFAESERFPFDQTDYYRESMGTDLFKLFLVMAASVDPECLAGVKVQTNTWEEAYTQMSEHTEPRPLNLDPGYLAEDKLVLASTKNHAHRLYLSQGIYAEFTLQFRGGKWQNCPWTYPDYQQETYQAFFTDCRNYLREQKRRTVS